MNVSLNWLKTLVDMNGLDPEQTAEILTVDGIPVEHVVYPGKDIDGIWTGKVVKIEKHPDADRLLVCQLDVGQEELVQIVTSAHNFKEGDIVPVVLNGGHVAAAHDSSVPGGYRYGHIKIKAGKLRGVKSGGMMCSCGELGLDDNLFPGVNKEGIMILPENTPVGIDFHQLFDLDDIVYEMELTANRADCFSMIGMALEVGAIFKRKLTLPEIKVVEQGESIEGRATVSTGETDLCSRFCGRLLENVKIGRSPEWIENRLRSNGIRPINNIVDAANYVMLEMGQPLHTYDYDKVAKHALSCRLARNGEVVKTLDGQDRSLTDQDLVIVDGDDKIACIAGVMGGFDSEVTEETKTVLVEAAVFDRASVRKTSRRLGLRSEASGRYEKGINANRTHLALNRICQLLEEQGAVTVAPGMLDDFPAKKEPKVITTTVDAITDYIGMKIPKETVLDILERLYFKVEEENGTLTAVVPDFRLDVDGMPDLAEEVARVFGYANIPNKTPWSAITKGTIPAETETVFSISNCLIENGLSEVVNYSFMDPKDLGKLNIPEDHLEYKAIKIMNPISEEYPVMRTTLLPGLMHTLQYNLSQKNENVAVFETGHIYIPRALPLTELPDEYERVAGLVMGATEEEGYPNGKAEYDFFTLKGIMENVLATTGVKDYSIERSQNSVFHPGISADFVKDGEIVLSFGELHPKVLDAWDIKKKVYGFVIYVEKVMQVASHRIDYTKIPKFPASERDLSLLVPNHYSNEQVANIITNACGKELEGLTLFDLYQGKQVKEGFKSMAYNLSFRVGDRTLTDVEVDGWIESVIKALEEHDITLRA